MTCINCFLISLLTDNGGGQGQRCMMAADEDGGDDDGRRCEIAIRPHTGVDLYACLHLVINFSRAACAS